LVKTFSTESSPARQAGILLGDVIVAVNDTTVEHLAQLQQMVGFRRAGESVRVTVVRREGARTGVRRTFNVRLAAAEGPREQASTSSAGDRRDRIGELEPRLGVTVEAIPSAMIQQARLSEDQQGVLVADVEDGGPAWQRLAPREEGGPDIILQVNDVRIRTPEDFKRALRSAPAGSVVQLRVLNLAQDGKPTRVVNLRTR